jgi:hypothetical protein
VSPHLALSSTPGPKPQSQETDLTPHPTPLRQQLNTSPHITCTSDTSQPSSPHPNQIHHSTTIAPSHHQWLAAQEEVHKISIPPTNTPTKPPLECNNAAAPQTPLHYQKNTQTQQEQQNKQEKQPATKTNHENRSKINL